MAKFTVYTDRHLKFRWKFISGDNVVIAKSGDSFSRQEDCLASLGLLQKDIGGAPIGYQFRKGVLPTSAVKAPAAPSGIVAPSTIAHPAGKVHPGVSASPAVASSAPIQPPPVPAIPPMSMEQFAPPPNN